MPPILRRPFFWIITAVVAVFAFLPALGDNVQLRESLALQPGQPLQAQFQDAAGLLFGQADRSVGGDHVAGLVDQSQQGADVRGRRSTPPPGTRRTAQRRKNGILDDPPAAAND